MSEEPEKLAEGTLISHLLELRDRLLRALVAVGIAFLPCVYYSNDLFSFMAQPLLAKLPQLEQMRDQGAFGELLRRFAHRRRPPARLA